jgi:hypothetical protein
MFIETRFEHDTAHQQSATFPEMAREYVSLRWSEEKYLSGSSYKHYVLA